MSGMSNTAGKASLAEDLRALVDDAAALLRATASAGGAQLEDQAQATLAQLRSRLATLEEQVREGVRDVDAYVHENPWQAIGVAAGLGLLVGLIVGRR
ncbi:MAG: DUF883 domain-containing protein [Gammaproteobacteria bacterium]|nr:DUF883 domain-containing protein [Gammaproteobacteria bacterium]